ncbi:MAG: VOC family protein, partial [Halobacteriales archaeon]|nr:VOC family protein [Halobacteriales archaeon]
MVGARKLEYAAIRVDDVAASVDYYTDVMGLVVLGREDETTYLGCGLDANVDLAVREGDPGLDRFAMRVTDEELDRLEARFAAEGIQTSHATAPGQDRGVYVELPAAGTPIGFVTVADTRYHHAAGATHFLDSVAPVDPGRSPIAPTDIDHMGLVSPDVEADCRWLERVAGFHVSDAKVDGGVWENAFVRLGNHHHDISVFARDPDERLDHIAFAIPDVNQMKLFCNRLAQRGHVLQKDFTKHGPGANVSLYFYEPGGI